MCDHSNEHSSVYEQVREIEHALTYTSQYFQSHAEQRLKTIRYFLAYILLLSVGLYTVLGSCHYGILFLGSSGGLIITLCFFGLELRNRELVRNASRACIELEKELISIMKKYGNENKQFKYIDIVQQGEKGIKWYKSYRYIVTILFISTSVLQLLVFIASLFSWLLFEFHIKLLPFDIFEILREGCS